MTLQKLALYVTAEKIVIFNLKRAYHSHFGDVNCPQSPCFRRIRKKTLFPSVFLIKMADEEGFEPPIRVTPYTRFRVARIQPLCHSSSVLFFFFKIVVVLFIFGMRALRTVVLSRLIGCVARRLLADLRQAPIPASLPLIQYVIFFQNSSCFIYLWDARVADYCPFALDWLRRPEAPRRSPSGSDSSLSATHPV